jgi:carboxyl-terminal processing protease
MIRIKLLAVIILLSITVASCDTFLGPASSSDPETVFTTLWNEFDRYYAGFNTRGVNWDSLYAVYRPRVTNQISDDSLYTTMLELIRELHDRHIYLESPSRYELGDTTKDDSSSAFASTVGFQEIFGFNYRPSLSHRFLYGSTPDSIGYIHISSFARDVLGPWFDNGRYHDWYNEIDDILRGFRDMDRIIIDVRDNDGGSVESLLAIAGRFVTKPVAALNVQTRSGAERNEFSTPSIYHITPTGSKPFTGRIVVLANNNTFSAGEWFVLIARQCFTATIIGMPTRGALSGSMARELPNGWWFSIPGQLVTTLDGVSYEGRGVPPDIVVPMSSSDMQSNHDPVLERALELLRN